MSEYITNIMFMREIFAVIMAILCISIFVIIIFESFFKDYFERRSEKLQKMFDMEEERYNKRKKEFKIKKRDTSSIDEEFKVIENDYDKIIKKNKQKSKNLTKGIYVSRIIALILIFINSIILIDLAFRSTGYTYSIIKLPDSTEEVYPTAYYEVLHKCSEEITLIVYVKNDSSQYIKSAIIQEEATGNTEEIYSLKPGEEKIVSIDIYPLENEEYNFIIKNVEYE